MNSPSVKYTGTFLDHCYDATTEILTQKGWKLIKDTKREDKIATLNKENKLEYHFPTKVIKERYEGKMYFVNGKNVDLLVSPNHQLFVGIIHRPKKNGKRPVQIEWTLKKAEDLKTKKFKSKNFCQWDGINKSFFYLPPVSLKINSSNQFGKNGQYVRKYPARKIRMSTWLEFLGYFISEGSTTIGTKRERYVQLRQKNSVILKKMLKVFSKISSNVYLGSDKERLLARDYQLFEYLKRLGKCWQKHIPREFLELESNKLKILFEALMVGDGHNLYGREYKGGSYYHTTSLRLVDDFQELLLKIGYSGSVTKVRSKGEKWNIEGREGTCKHDGFNVSINYANNQSNTTLSPTSYSGFIYCVTVPNHVIYVRRNGKPVWSGNSGYGNANRNFITSLFLSGINVSTELVTQVPEKSHFGWTGELCKHLEDRNHDYKIKFIHLTPDMYHKYLEKGKYHIGHLFWETDRLPEEWVPECNKMNEIWTASEAQAEMIKSSGVTAPIYWFPQPIDTSLIDGKLSPWILPNFYNLDDSKVVFYSVFQWIERKNPRDLITTYWQTFEGEEDVVLLLKTYGTNYGEDQFNWILDQIKTWKTEFPQSHYPKIMISKKLLTTKEVFRLHLTGNCYICTSRGEGWCIPVSEAMLMGKPVIGIDHTGIFDYLNKDQFLSCQTSLSKVKDSPQIRYYRSPQKWLDINKQDLSKQMLWIYNNRKEASELGKKGKEFVENNFNYWTVGAKMRERIEQILKFI